MSDDMKRDIEMIKGDIGALKADVSVLKTDVGVLKTDVSVLKTDVSVLKTDVSVLKTDVSVLKTDVGVLKTDVSVLKKDVISLRGTTTKMAVEISRIGGQMNGLATQAEMSKGFDKMISTLVSFAGEVEVSRRERALQDQSFNSLNDRLVNHELRLNRLEAPGKKS
jgi:chromosome segregation ATPase